MIGELKPQNEILRHYVGGPIPVKVAVATHSTWDFTGETEVEVALPDGTRLEATVPRYVLDEEDATLEGSALGVLNDRVVVQFPPTQISQAKLLLPEGLLTVVGR